MDLPLADFVAGLSPLLLLWLCLAIAACLIGARKGQGLFGFLIGLLLGPIGIVLMLFTRGNRKSCPSCRELIDKAAMVCPHCQRDVGLIKPPAPKMTSENISKVEAARPEDERFAQYGASVKDGGSIKEGS